MKENSPETHPKNDLSDGGGDGQVTLNGIFLTHMFKFFFFKSGMFQQCILSFTAGEVGGSASLALWEFRITRCDSFYCFSGGRWRSRRRPVNSLLTLLFTTTSGSTGGHDPDGDGDERPSTGDHENKPSSRLRVPPHLTFRPSSLFPALDARKEGKGGGEGGRGERDGGGYVDARQRTGL